MEKCFEIPEFILRGLFSLAVCCAVKWVLFKCAAMNSYMSLYSIFYMNISAHLGVTNPSKHSIYYYFRHGRLNHRAMFI